MQPLQPQDKPLVNQRGAGLCILAKDHVDYSASRSKTTACETYAWPAWPVCNAHNKTTFNICRSLLGWAIIGVSSPCFAPQFDTAFSPGTSQGSKIWLIAIPHSNGLWKQMETCLGHLGSFVVVSSCFWTNTCCKCLVFEAGLQQVFPVQYTHDIWPISSMYKETSQAYWIWKKT